MMKILMVSVLKTNGLCLNCLRPGHFVKDCVSAHRCKKCQKPHHTLLHIEAKEGNAIVAPSPPTNLSTTPVSTHAAVGIKSNILLMTCRIMVEAPHGSSVEARALLDSASSASFVSERQSGWHSPCDFLALTRVFVSLVSHVTHWHSISLISRSPLFALHPESSLYLLL